MRIPTALIGCLVIVALGCTNAPPPPVPAGPATELVPLKIAFDDTFADTEGAKRVVVCQLRDERTSAAYVGEGPVTGDRSAMTKYVMKDDPTLVLPRVLAKDLKGIGLNVSMAERLSDTVGGAPVREMLKRYEGDYLIAGQLDEISVRARGDADSPVFVTVQVRLNLYNKTGELRMPYVARSSDSAFLGEKSGDPNEVNALLERAVAAAFDAALDEPYVLKALDLDPETVKQIRAGQPVPGNTAPSKPEDKPAETKPDAGSTAPKADPAKELDEAVGATKK